ncbi:hypothetical protein, partial [Larkinella soli]|uniref:hypothetical protein n=1 Tax=Larkinella soli TaxID=1770527 RepID=UPI0019D143CB
FLCLLMVLMATAFQLTDHEIPRTWDLESIHHSHLPPPDTTVRVSYAPEAYYNDLPEHVIYKTFPVYLQEYEKPGYLDSLRQLEPEVAFDPGQLKTREDWIKAGELVFNWPVAYTPINEKVGRLNRNLFRGGKGKFTPDGRYLVNRYVLQEKGRLLVGSLSCASCHTRVMESGEVVPGAQGNGFTARPFAEAVQAGKIPYQALQTAQRQLHYAPWAAGRPVAAAGANAFADHLLAVPAEMNDRQGTGQGHPVTVPSLIGIKDIRYLDYTGLMRHEGPGDLMRYAAFNQGMDMQTAYNGFIPGGKNSFSERPASSEWKHPFGYVGRRYSDAQLYALTQYLYSLKPPENPYRFRKATLVRGERVFRQAGCVTCHTPPLYTNNKLTPANGFTPPAGHLKAYDIFNVSVGTDSVHTLYTRRGTGYYKVPSLRGVWYRSAFFHDGHLTQLHEVLDPKRLQPDYVPTGFKPPHRPTMAVKGHPFGLDLPDEDKTALIAFLRTL